MRLRLRDGMRVRARVRARVWAWVRARACRLGWELRVRVRGEWLGRG